MEGAISHDDAAKNLHPDAREGQTGAKTCACFMSVCVKFCHKVTLNRRFAAQACLGAFSSLLLAGGWPRFVELGLGLVLRTLFGGNGGVNTKGLVQRVASLSGRLFV